MSRVLAAAAVLPPRPLLPALGDGFVAAELPFEPTPVLDVFLARGLSPGTVFPPRCTLGAISQSCINPRRLGKSKPTDVSISYYK